MNSLNNSYKQWLVELKNKIRSSQIKAAIVVNSALIHFYWELGRMISEKQSVWGSHLIAKLSKDLQEEFPNIKGLSERNLKYCRMFYQFYAVEIGQQVVAQFQYVDNKEITQYQRPDNLSDLFLEHPIAKIP